MHILPTNFYFRYEVVVEAFNRLLKILSKDKHLLKEGNLEMLEKTIDERVDLINFLLLQQTSIKKDPNIISSLKPEQKKHLAELSAKLKELTEASEKEFAKAIIVNQKVMHFLAKIVRREKIKSVGYNQVVARKLPGTLETPSLALNQTI